MKHKRLFNYKKETKFKNEYQSEAEESKYRQSMELREEKKNNFKSDKISKYSKSQENDTESSEEYSDEEMISINQIYKIFEKEEKNKKKEENKKKDLLGHKRVSKQDEIMYNEKMGDFINIFCPRPEELNDFLTHCQMKIISYDEFYSSLNYNSKIKSFNPDEWMKANKIEQRTINIEDLTLYYSTKIEDKNRNNNLSNESIKEEKDIDININIKSEEEILNDEKDENGLKIFKKFKNPQINYNYSELKNIISSEIISMEQKNWLQNLFKELKNFDIKDIKIEKNKEGKDNKLELVFDLDNTCIFSFLTHSNNKILNTLKNKYQDKKVEMIKFIYNNREMYSILIIRKGLKELFKYVEPLCNFHVSTLADDNYGKEITNLLTKKLNVKFVGFKGRSIYCEQIKKISDLKIKKENTIIFDDNVKVWDNRYKDSSNVIISKLFFDEECEMITSIKEYYQKNNQVFEKDLFLKSYKSFYYNKNRNNNKDWKSQQVAEVVSIPFYQFRKLKDYNYNKCFTAEYLNSKKLQFIYMKNVIKEIYILKFTYNILPSLAIKLIRISTLSNMKFDLKYLRNDLREILTQLIKICGGIILEKDLKENNEKIYLVVCKRLYEYIKEKIKNDLQKYPYYVLINERFILDTYYFMTNLEDNVNDSEYTFNENE